MTKRFLLRQFTDGDLVDVYRGLSDPLVIRYYGVSFKTLEETKEQMQFFENLEKDKTGLWWAICSADNTTFYGGAGFNNWSRSHRKAEIGFWILPEYWRQGIITEVIPVICDYGYTTMDLHRIEAFVESENTSCINAMHKLIFTYEGNMRDCEIKNGSYISIDIFSKLSSK